MKLVYFNFGGTAEAIRLAFHLRGIAFDDVRLTAAEFEAKRIGFPFGKLPVLMLPTGEQIPQSAAILRYAATVGGHTPLLYPKDPLEALRCDALVDAVQDFNEAMRPSMGQFLPDLDHDTMLKRRQTLAENFLPQWLGNVSSQLNEEGPFCLGSDLFMCDLALFCRLKWLRKGILEGIPSTMVDEHPRLTKLLSAVQNVKGVQDYYSDHQIERSGWLIENNGEEAT